LFFANTDHRTWFALAGVDVEVHPGSYPLTIDAILKDGTHRTLHQDVKVEEAPYEKVAAECAGQNLSSPTLQL